MAQLLAKFRSNPMKSLEKKVHHLKNSDPLSPLYSKVSDFVSHGSESMSMKRLVECFDLIDLTNKAFSKLLVDLDYPANEWGCVATEEYLSYTMNMLTLLNSVHSSVSQLNHAKLSILQALMATKRPSSLEKIPVINLGKELKFEKESYGVGVKPSSEKERVVLQALSMVKIVGYLALGFVTTGLCSTERLYDEIKTSIKGFKDSQQPPLVMKVDSMFRGAIVQNHGICEEVRDVNCYIKRILGGKPCDEAVAELRMKLELLGELLQVIEKQGHELFSQVIAARTELIDGFIDRELAYL